jgi:hypothetical protein
MSVASAVQSVLLARIRAAFPPGEGDRLLSRLDAWHERVAVEREAAMPGAGARFLRDTARWRFGEGGPS